MPACTRPPSSGYAWKVGPRRRRVLPPIALERGEGRILSLDMGGTTAKICLIDNGPPLKSRAFEVDRAVGLREGSGTPLRIPVIEIVA